MLKANYINSYTIVIKFYYSLYFISKKTKQYKPLYIV